MLTHLFSPKRLSLFFSPAPMLLCSLALLFLVLPAFSLQRWERTYGGTNSEEGRSVQQTTDGGYIITGRTVSFGVGGDVWLIKVNASGDTLWTRTYGGLSGDWGHSVQQTLDRGYIIAGNTAFGAYYNVYLVKTNSQGDTLWTRSFGGSNNDEGYSVQQTSDECYIVAGMTHSFGAGGYDVYLIKTNALGDTLWTRTYGGAGNDVGTSVKQTSDGGYILVGWSSSFGNSEQVYLIKVNASGDTLWSRIYGGSNVDEGGSVQQTSDGGYIIAGYTASFGAGGCDVYLIKTNNQGDTLWTRTYGGSDNDYVGWSGLQQTTDSGYIITGSTYSFGAGGYDVYLIKTNALGDTLWTRTYGGPNWDLGCSVQQTSDGGFIIAGAYSIDTGSNVDVYLIKTDANGSSGVETDKGFEGSRVQGVKVTPNPFTSFASVPGHASERFALYDISGRRVGIYKGDRIGWDVSPGVYFLRPDTRPPQPASRILRIVKLR